VVPHVPSYIRACLEPFFLISGGGGAAAGDQEKKLMAVGRLVAINVSIHRASRWYLRRSVLVGAE
jgi:hypothetical protein